MSSLGRMLASHIFLLGIALNLVGGFESEIDLGTRIILPQEHAIIRLPIKQDVLPAVEILNIRTSGCPCLQVVNYPRRVLAKGEIAWCIASITGSDRQGWRKPTGIVAEVTDPSNGSKGTIRVRIVLETQAPIRFPGRTTPIISVAKGETANAGFEANPTATLPWDACSIDQTSVFPFQLDISKTSTSAWILSASCDSKSMPRHVGTVIRPTSVMVWNHDCLVWKRDLSLMTEIEGNISVIPSRIVLVPDEQGVAHAIIALRGGKGVDLKRLSIRPNLPLAAIRGLGEQVELTINVGTDASVPTSATIMIPNGSDEILEVPVVISIPETNASEGS